MTYRSPKWLKAVRQVECCVRCGAHGTEAAHRNEGKGMGLKASDALTAALCRACHVEIDTGQHMTRAERRAEIDRAIVLTLGQLVSLGLVAPT